ncbi:putative MFS family arabinose efflux permease [Lipingzhangella halophila]|uniref:Putative MFS family arabinose efflux permease n=1 Tax=Lipingzhangella halophila TaxID=1783352 RepID=A0A7W7RGX0_9ACTN|nr:MFS transporter [Lipingzhangella halophila]MBB4931757.1 putative MFS family arabinose efflux permease [Lipingzhangella halophila]
MASADSTERAVPAPPAADTQQRSPARGWMAVCAVTLGIFTLMTTELVPVGLLRPIGASLAVSDGAAGLMVTGPGLVAAVSAPVTIVVLGRTDRRVVLALLLGVLVAANLTSALAPHFAVLLAARLLVGVSIGGFWAIAGSLALRLVAERHVARATSIIFGGVAAASVLGVPLATVLGDLAGWRTAFAGLGALGLVAVGLLLILVPRLPASEPIRFGELPSLVRTNVGVRAGIVLTVLLVTGHFTAFTYVRPLLSDVSGVAAGLVGGLLLGYGAVGIAGNFLAGAGAGRDARRTVLWIAVLLSAALPVFALVGTTPLGGGAALLLWGMAYGGVSVGLQSWMIATAPRAAEAATALFVCAFNAAIAFGALFGGLVVDTLDVPAAPWAGTALTVLGVAVAAAARRRPRNV